MGELVSIGIGVRPLIDVLVEKGYEIEDSSDIDHSDEGDQFNYELPTVVVTTTPDHMIADSATILGILNQVGVMPDGMDASYCVLHEKAGILIWGDGLLKSNWNPEECAKRALKSAEAPTEGEDSSS